MSNCNSIRIGYYKRVDATWSSTGQDLNGYWRTTDGSSCTIECIIQHLDGAVVECRFYSDDELKSYLSFFFGEGFWFGCKNGHNNYRSGRGGFRDSDITNGIIFYDL